MRSQERDQLEPLETLPGYRISISDTSRLVIIDETILVCSAGEYRLLVQFLRSPDRVIPFTQLLGEGYHMDDPLARQNLGRQISRLRERVWPCGLDICCLLGRGYLLFALSDQSQPY